MKLVIINICLVFCLSEALLAQQSVDEVLRIVETNNTELIKIGKQFEAGVLANKTSLLPENPEIEFHYLWGNNADVGTRTDFSISQSFDFPTSYVHKKKLSEYKINQAKLEYFRQKKAILFNAKNICIKLIHKNALIEIYTQSLHQAEQIEMAVSQKFEQGASNRIELNKASLNLLNTRKALESVIIEKEKLLNELKTLNGGKDILLNIAVYSVPLLPPDFEAWYKQQAQNNPLLNWLKKQVEVSEKEIQLQKAMRLPKVSVGYMSEAIVGEEFKGLTFGVSIPLWENKNKVNYAKINAEATESALQHLQVEMYNELKSLHQKAVKLQNTVSDYKQLVEQYSNVNLLKEAYEQKQLSLIDYLYEQSIYYESLENVLQLEKELNITFAKLYRFL
ncbi:TolC family protein [Roseimarinus sediminis]|uniref:TolC family protein n=1 Tax=Roseimarinus sediminis TaxID=1610899 RepID=UPI003D1B5433